MYADIEKRNERRKERYYEKRQDLTYVCRCCSTEYHPKAKNRDKYCSRACSDKQKAIHKIARIERKEEHKSITFCDHCGLVHSTSTSIYCSDKCRMESRNHKAAMRKSEYKNVECKCCGKEFMQEYKKSKVYCTDECRKTYLHTLKKIRRKYNIVKNGEVDYGISLQRLIEKDNNICHICGMPCDDSDFSITVKEYRITGDNYPSIDHVIPLNKGGTHTHDNVKLAHFKCNYIKGDSI